MVRQEIVKLIKEAAKKAGFSALAAVHIDYPEDEKHGDYATNFALQTAKTIRLTPKAIANNLRSHILNLEPALFEKIEIADPGFLNFFISKQYLYKQVGEILRQKEFFGKLKTGQGKKISIESVSANPTGQLHIGNGRNAFSGDVLSNVLEKAGYKVVREYFVNDAKNSKQIIELGKTALGKGETYKTVRIVSLLEKNKITGQTESEAGWQLAQIIQNNNKDFLEKKLKVKFDKWVSEEEAIYQQNKINKMLDWLKKNNLVYEKDQNLPVRR